jgi:hypothetical protein
VEEYVASLPPEWGRAVAALRQLIVERLPEGFEECMAFGMIGYVVPLSRYPKTYNGQPLMLAALASQKAYLSLYFDERVRRSGDGALVIGGLSARR